MIYSIKISVPVIDNLNSFHLSSWIAETPLQKGILRFSSLPSSLPYLSLISPVTLMQLSAAIRKIRIPSDNCEDAGTILYNLDAIIAIG